MTNSRFAFVIPVYNEESRILPLIDELAPFLASLPGSILLMADNGSRDRTVELIQLRMKDYPFIQLLTTSEKGQGLAFSMAMKSLRQQRLDPNTWVVFSAADLPFQFSDALAVMKFGAEFDLVVGCKSHPRSQIDRGFMRAILSFGYQALRRVLLGMKTRDPQGSLFFKASHLPLEEQCFAKNYFFATQLVYAFEKRHLAILEVPIIFRPDPRPSNVNFAQDSFKILLQIWSFSRTVGRIPKPRPIEALQIEALGPSWK